MVLVRPANFASMGVFTSKLPFYLKSTSRLVQHGVLATKRASQDIFNKDAFAGVLAGNLRHPSAVLVYREKRSVTLAGKKLCRNPKSAGRITQVGMSQLLRSVEKKKQPSNKLKPHLSPISPISGTQGKAPQ